MQFKNHAEKDFWQEVYLRIVTDYGDPGAATQADTAVEDRRSRMLELAVGQKPPEHMNLPE